MPGGTNQSSDGTQAVQFESVEQSATSLQQVLLKFVEVLLSS